MIQMIKIPVVSLYYIIYLMFEKWLNIWTILGFLLSVLTGILLAEKEKKISFNSKRILMIEFIGMYIAVLSWVIQYGGLVDSMYNVIVFFFYFITNSLFLLSVSNEKWLELKRYKEKESRQLDEHFYNKIKNIIEALFFLSLIPILAISPYVFAKADDYNFGYRSHIAWERTGNIIEVFKASFEMVKEAYYGWQGTYSSIFMMSLQPAVFDEKLYSIVPLLFILSISFASYFFLQTITVKLLQANKSLCGICTMIYIFLVIQTVPVKQSAFLWYNGAVHYVGAHCILLCMIAFIVRSHITKHPRRNWVGAAICAIYVGGANHVTAVSTLLLVITVFFILLVTRRWKKYYKLWTVGIIFLIALAINVMAPGNFNKMEMHTGMGIIPAFVQAFFQSVEYMFGEWMHWTIVFTFLICIPFIWKIVSKINLNFRYPLLFVMYSWGYMASMFFTPIVTLGHAKVGRFQNIMFMQMILWIFFDIGYICGWIQKRCKIAKDTQLCRNEKKYLIFCSIAGLIMVGVSSIAEPEKYTSIYAARTLREENLPIYAQDYWHNVEILNSKEKEVVLKDLDNIPSFLKPEESDIWYSALRLFYEKDTIEFEDK